MTHQEKKLFEIVKIEGATTWWMSDFYDNACKLFKYDANDIKKNMNKIRYHLNKLTKKGYLKKSTLGVGYGGRGLYNSNHCTLWVVDYDSEMMAVANES